MSQNISKGIGGVTEHPDGVLGIQRYHSFDANIVALVSVCL